LDLRRAAGIVQAPQIREAVAFDEIQVEGSHAFVVVVVDSLEDAVALGAVLVRLVRVDENYDVGEALVVIDYVG
jgi:hypothetical protein